MTISEEMLMAYADEQLDAAGREQVERAIAADPSLKTIVEQHRALRADVRAAFDPVLEEPIPSRLQASLNKGPADEANVLAFRRGEKSAKATVATRRPAWSWPVWGSMAASVVLGVVVGRFALNGSSSDLVSQGDGLVARGTLSRALNQQLASTQSARETVRIRMSYRDKAGAYCRSFQAHGDRELAGLACVSSGEWQIRMLTQSEAEGDGAYRTAGSSMPPAILEEINETIQGEPLDAAAESAAAQKGWGK